MEKFVTINILKEHLNTHKLIYALVTVIILFNLPVFSDLIYDWYLDDNYSHGFLIIPISIFLFYQKRDELVFPAKTSPQGLIVLLLGCIGYVFGIAAGEYFTTRFSLVVIFTGVSIFYLGWMNFKKVWFSYFFLIFMIPIPSIIYYSATAPMQLFASEVTNTFLQNIGVPSIRHGNIIILPEYRLEVAEACSGLRSLVTLLALSSLYANWKFDGKTIAIVLFLATFPIAVVANIFRIITTALGAYAIDKSLAESFLHEISGTIVFLVALILIFILGALLKWAKNRLA